MGRAMITYNYGNSHSPITLLQMVGDHDLPGIENEIREIHRLTDQEFAFVAVKVENWNPIFHHGMPRLYLERKILETVRKIHWKKYCNCVRTTTANTVSVDIRWQDYLPCGQPCRQIASKVSQQYPPRSGFRDSWKI